MSPIFMEWARFKPDGVGSALICGVQGFLESSNRVGSATNLLGDLNGVELSFKQQPLDLPAFFDADPHTGATDWPPSLFDGFADFVVMGEIVSAANR